MPKKKTKKKKPEEKIKESEKKSEEDESQIDDLHFQEFMQPLVESFSPVLEKVGNVQELGDLEQEITPAQKPEEQQPHRDYFIASNEPGYSVAEEKVKYQSSTEQPVLKPLRDSEELPRQAFLEPEERRIAQTDTESRKLAPEFRHGKTKLPFEQDKKYKEVNF